MMDLRDYLKESQAACERNQAANAADGNESSATYWKGRALSFQAVLSAVESGVVTEAGTVRLTYPTTQETTP